MHDRNGTPLKRGDIVLIPARIVQDFGAEEYCNVEIETLYGRRPDGASERISAINTGVVVLHERG